MPDLLADLLVAFDALPLPAASPAGGSTSRLSGCPIPGFEAHRLAKDSYGAPALLVVAADEVTRVRPAPILLEHLSVQHDVACRLVGPDGTTEDGRFTVVRCLGADRMLQTFFLRVVGAAVGALGTRPARREVTRAIDQLVELFRSMARPPRQSAQGLWAELCLIATARDPAVLVAAWRETQEDRHDFGSESEHIEVKSASGRIRQHHFSLEQLRPPGGASVLIASMLLSRMGGGSSLAELVDEVRTHVAHSPPLMWKVDRVVALTLGSDLRSAMGERFDREAARVSLVFVEAPMVPTIHPDLPPEVSDVHFQVDLTGVPSVDRLRQRAMGGLFQAALPR